MVSLTPKVRGVVCPLYGSLYRLPKEQPNPPMAGPVEQRGRETGFCTVGGREGGVCHVQQMRQGRGHGPVPGDKMQEGGGLWEDCEGGIREAAGRREEEEGGQEGKMESEREEGNERGKEQTKRNKIEEMNKEWEEE